MAVLKMQRISICALKKDRKAILEKLQSLGVVEINHVIEEDEDFKKMDTAGQKAGFEKASTLAEQAIDILDKYVPEKKSMFASLEGKALIEREEEERIRNERRDLLKTAKQIGRLDKERSEQMAEITKLNNSIESLNPWISLDVPLTPAETDRTAVFFGTMPGGTDAETVYGILAEKAPSLIIGFPHFFYFIPTVSKSLHSRILAVCRRTHDCKLMKLRHLRYDNFRSAAISESPACHCKPF